MWKMIYWLLAWMSGGPTIEAVDDWASRYWEMMDNYWSAASREADLSQQLGEAHAKIDDLESECNAFCDVINDLLQKVTVLDTAVAEDRETVAHARQSVADGIRREARLNDTVARWKTAHDTMKQQRDEALEQLAAIQEQTAKYVRT